MKKTGKKYKLNFFMESLIDKNYLETFLNECTLENPNPFVFQLDFTFSNKGKLYIGSEFFGAGSLLQHLEN